jgi:hypothetical protein
MPKSPKYLDGKRDHGEQANSPVAGRIVSLIVVFWSWYSVAADYSYGAVSGVYTFAHEGEFSTLILKPDHSFQQEFTYLGKVEHA